MTENNLFVLLAAAGLTTQFGLQALINLGVNLHLLPTKGMTLPFISYGGSSLLPLALSMGMLLALTRWPPANRVLRSPRTSPTPTHTRCETNRILRPPAATAGPLSSPHPCPTHIRTAH